jgi:hypothetical protein
MKTQKRRLTWHGMLLFLLGLITGFWPYCPEDGRDRFLKSVLGIKRYSDFLSLTSGVSNHD